MTKKITKILLMLLTIFMVFFYKINGVKAEECNYISPFVSVGLEGDNPYGVIARLNISNGISNRIIDGIYLSSMDFNDGSVGSQIGYYIKYNNGKDILAMINGVIRSDVFKNCPDYVTLTISGSDVKVSSSTAKNYKAYLRTQLSLIKPAEGKLYVELHTKFFDMVSSSHCHVGDYCLDASPNKILKYLDFQTINNSLVFRKITDSNGELYPNTNYSNFHSILEKVSNSKGETVSEILKAFDLIVDTGYRNQRSYDNMLYEVTKDKIKKYIDGVNNKTTTITGFEKIVLQKWFYYCGRYIFEDSIKDFKEYFEFFHRKGIVAFNNEDSNTIIGEFTEEQYNMIIKVLDDMLGISSVDDYIGQANQDVCLPICSECIDQTELYEKCKSDCESKSSGDSTEKKNCIISNCTKYNLYNYQSCVECQSDNITYDVCSECQKKNKTELNNCLNNAESAYNASNDSSSYKIHKKECYERYLKPCMGDRYDSFYKSYSDFIDTMEETKDDFASDMVDELKKLYDVSKLSEAVVPELNLDFNEGYVANCDDVKVFHIIYRFMIFLAPALVIVLGSLDYAKIVINSDEKKQQQFKKHFRSRIILLVLLIMVPLIIELILNIYSGATNNSLDNNLMYCIIKGSK